MLSPLFQRGQLDSVGAGFARRFVPLECLAYVPRRSHGTAEQQPILYGDACALAEEWQERMGSIAQHRHATTGPGLQGFPIT